MTAIRMLGRAALRGDGARSGGSTTQGGGARPGRTAAQGSGARPGGTTAQRGGARPGRTATQGGATAARPGLRELLREDWIRHDRSWARPGLHAVTTHRIGRWMLTLPAPLRLPMKVLHGAMYFVVRNLYGIELPLEADIGRRLRISHQGALVVNGASTIGDDCLLRHNVTLGAPNAERAAEAPVLGNDVQIGPGAVLVGRITVGDGARIGPNALVVEDVPPGARVVAAVATTGPGRPRRQQGAAV